MSARRNNAFTLLEALLAIAILASVMIVTLSMRAASMKRTASLAGVHRDDREIISLFHLLRSGMLSDPQEDETKRLVWQGDHLDRPYQVVRDLVVVRNPDYANLGPSVAQRIAMYRYRISYGSEQREFLWHR